MIDRARAAADPVGELTHLALGTLAGDADFVDRVSRRTSRLLGGSRPR
ncbi:MAG TPA: hypothetical protein VJU58_12420 [Microbacterium sp.]|nr:hypothetical protein [Microbacterium sp.]